MDFKEQLNYPTTGSVEEERMTSNAESFIDMEQQVLEEQFYPYVHLQEEETDVAFARQRHDLGSSVEENNAQLIENKVSMEGEHQKLNSNAKQGSEKVYIKSEAPEEFDIKEEPLDFTNEERHEEQIVNQHVQPFQSFHGHSNSFMRPYTVMENVDIRNRSLGQSFNCVESGTTFLNDVSHLRNNRVLGTSTNLSENYKYNCNDRINYTFGTTNSTRIDSENSFASTNVKEKSNIDCMVITLKCEKCSFNSTDSDSMLSHLRSGCRTETLLHEVPGPVPVRGVGENSEIHEKLRNSKCYDCGFCAKDINLLCDHLSNSCNTSNSKSLATTGGKPLKQTSGAKVENEPKLIYKCTICDFKCSLSSSLKRHKRRHLVHVNAEFSSGGTDADPSAEINENRDKILKCTLCDYETLTKHSLKRHTFTHTGERPFKCNICDYRASNKYALSTHSRRHTGEKPYKCTLCNYKASQKSALTTHLRTHSGERPYKCHLCSYTSRYGHALKTHIRNHLGERPFKCEKCSYAAVQKRSLTVHMKIHP